MKVSVIMVDGSFRDEVYSAQYFAEQDFDQEEFEIIWVEFYEQASSKLEPLSKVQVVTLNNATDVEYHSSYCFNEGIRQAKGDLLVIPDADQIVKPDFLSNLWSEHQKSDNQVIYCYRYDESEGNRLSNHTFEELETKCVLKNPVNYGGCLSVKKKWLLKINGYEQHPLFGSGFHANGLDIYTRFKNLGLAISWNRDLKLYHPWHEHTLAAADVYNEQRKLIHWRARNLQYLAINGIDESLNSALDVDAITQEDKSVNQPSLASRVKRKLKF